MKFSSRHDTDYTPEYLFQAVSDFDRVERMLTRRGAIVRRVEPTIDSVAGMAWDVGFDWRGRRRDLHLNLTRYEPSEVLAFEGSSEMFDLSMDLTVIALTRSKARLQFEVDVRPRSMKARLLLQTAKLGKAQLDRRFSLRVAEFLDDAARAAA